MCPWEIERQKHSLTPQKNAQNAKKKTILADDSFVKNEAEAAELIDLGTQEKRKIVVDEKLLEELGPKSKSFDLYFLCNFFIVTLEHY